MTTSNEVFYSIELTSRFSGFLDDPLSSEDPTILLSKLQNERAEQRKQARERKTSHKGESGFAEVETPTTAGTGETDVTSTTPVESAERKPFPAQRGRGGRGRRPFRGVPRGPREPRQDDRSLPATGEGVEKDQRPSGFNPRGNRPRGRGTFNPRFQKARGTGGPRGFSNKPFEKKEVEFEEPAQSPETEAPIENGDAPEQQSSETGDIKQTKPAPDEPVGYTLEEYKAMKAAKAAAVQPKVVRAPNDGKDVFANMKSHTKVVPETEAKEEVSSSKLMDKTDDSIIQMTFSRGEPRAERGRGNFRGVRATRGGPARGGRGAPRGFGGPAKFFGPAVPPPSLHDDQEFPSLSSK